MIVIMLAVTVVIFTITYFIPGDPARVIMGSSATEAEVAAKRVQMGLDKPYLGQLLSYFSAVYLHGDFGTSWATNSPVLSSLLERLPITILIGGIGMIIQVLIGVPLGVLAATHQGKWQDYASISLSMQDRRDLPCSKSSVQIISQLPGQKDRSRRKSSGNICFQTP